MPHFPRGPRQVHRRFRGRSCPSLISGVAVNPDALCRSENWAKRAKVRRLVGSGGPLTIYLRKRRLRTANHGGRPLTIRLKGLIASPLLSQIVQPKTIRRSRRAPSPLSRSSDVAKRKAMRATSRPCLWRWASLESVSALTAASACQMLRPVHA